MVGTDTAARITALALVAMLLLAFSPLPLARNVESRIGAALAPISAALNDAVRPVADVLLNAGQLADGEPRFVIVQHPFFQPRAAKNRPEKRRRLTSVAGAPTSEVRAAPFRAATRTDPAGDRSRDAARLLWGPWREPCGHRGARCAAASSRPCLPLVPAPSQDDRD